MRYIALFLVLANIAYFIWWETRPPRAEVPSSGPRPLLNNGLMLLSEFDRQSALQARLNAEAARLCTVVSGFSSVDDANSFMAQARASGMTGLLNLTGTALEPQYRVYLPPASSREVAAITLDGLSERLQAAEIEAETYLITRGLLENGIALGVFDDGGAAQGVREAVSDLGYEVQIEEIPRSDGAAEVWLRPVESDRIDDAQWLDLSAERPDLTRSENLCETIAQASQFP